VCTAPCEICLRAAIGEEADPVGWAARQDKRAIEQTIGRPGPGLERHSSEPQPQPSRTVKRVAVVGLWGGGTAAHKQLPLAGHDVTLPSADDRNPGGG